MNFSLANNAPIGIMIDGKSYRLPRMKRSWWADWAAEIDAERTDKATAGMNEDKRYKYLSVFPIEPSTRADMARRAFTDAGIKRIVRTCGAAGGVPADELDRLIEEGGKDVETLAVMLASVVDPDQMAAAAAESEEGGFRAEDGRDFGHVVGVGHAGL